MKKWIVVLLLTLIAVNQVYSQHKIQKTKSAQSQSAHGCAMTDSLFLRMVMYAGSDLLMAEPHTFQSVKVAKIIDVDSPLIYLIIMNEPEFDSTLSFRKRSVSTLYRNKLRQRLLGRCHLEVWTFRKEIDAVKVFSTLKRIRPDPQSLFVAVFDYMRMGNNILILTSGQRSNSSSLKRLAQIIEKKYICLGKIERDN